MERAWGRRWPAKSAFATTRWSLPEGQGELSREGWVITIYSSLLAYFLEARESGAARVDCCAFQVALDAEQLVVLRHALGAGRGTGLDLAAIQSDGQVSDGGVLGLAGAVGHHGAVAVAVCQFHGVEGLGEGTDLVHLDQQGVGRATVDALLQAGRVGDEEVVANDLDLVAELLGEGDVSLPVVLVQRVLDGDDRVLLDQVSVDLNHLGGAVLTALEVV